MPLKCCIRLHTLKRKNTKMIMLGIGVTAIVLLLTLLYYLTRGQDDHHPPGPKGKPFVGVLFEIELDRLYRKVHEWSLKYGDVFQFKLLGKTFVSLNSEEALRDAFIKEPNGTITAARPQTYYGQYMFANSDLVLASPSKEWAKRRKFAHQVIHAYGEGLQQIEKQVQQNLNQVKNELTNGKGRDIDPADFIEEFILKTIEILLIGRSFGKDGELQKLMKRIDYLINTTANPGTDYLYLSFPFLRYLPFKMSALMDECITKEQELLDKLNKYTENGDEYDGVFFKMKEILKENEKLEEPWFTKVTMMHMTENLSVAAFLTTRGTLLSMVQLLAKRKPLQERLQQEIDRVIGPQREPNLSDRGNCPLTEAVILESLRYTSLGPLSIFHRTMEPCTINGYRIGKDVIIIPNLWTIHNNEKHWGDPFHFRPERFLDEEGNLLPSTAPERKRLLSFGIGKRSCIGEVFAKSRMFLFLATMMQTITILEPESESLPDLVPNEMLPGFVLQPSPYKVRYALR